MKISASQIHPLPARRFCALLAISIVCGLASPVRADDADTAARRKADELIAQAEKQAPDLVSKSGMPNLREARLQGEARAGMERLFTEAVEAAPNYATAYLVRAKYRQERDLFGSQSDWEMVRKLAPELPESYLQLSYIANRLWDFGQAKKLAAEAYSRLVASDGAASEPKLTTAAAAFAAGQWKDVVALATRALRDNRSPDFKKWLTFGGLSKVALGQDGPGEADLSIAEVFGSQVAFYSVKAPGLSGRQVLDLALKYRQSGGSAMGANELLTRAIELDPKLGEAYLLRAQNRWEAREKLLRKKARYRRLKIDELDDFLIVNVLTPVKIRADCDEAERLGADVKKISEIRGPLSETSYLGFYKFHRFPAATLAELNAKVADPKVGLEDLKKSAALAAELSVPQEQRIAFYDQVIARDPEAPFPYFARAALRWSLIQEAKLGKQNYVDDIWEKARRPRAGLPAELLLNDSGPEKLAPVNPGSSGFGAGPGLSTELTYELVALQKPLDLLLSEHPARKVYEDCLSASRLGYKSRHLDDLLRATTP